MDGLTFDPMVVVTIILASFNELAVWKLWQRCVCEDMSAQRKTIVSTMLLDPLVAVIVCPLTTDIFFTFKWAVSCELSFVYTIATVTLILYTSILMVIYRMVTSMYPVTKMYPVNKFSNLLKIPVDKFINMWTHTLALSFSISVVANIMITWTTLVLSLDPHFDREYLQAENCWTSILKRNALFVFVLCFSMQIIHVVFYGLLSQSISKKNVFACSLSTIDDSLVQQDDNSTYSSVIYILMGLFCLSMANILRFSYTICSCHSYLQLTHSLYYTNWLIVIKLPCVGLFYWAASMCQRKRQ